MTPYESEMYYLELFFVVFHAPFFMMLDYTQGVILEASSHSVPSVITVTVAWEIHQSVCILTVNTIM